MMRGETHLERVVGGGALWGRTGAEEASSSLPETDSGFGASLRLVLRGVGLEWREEAKRELLVLRQWQRWSPVPREIPLPSAVVFLGTSTWAPGRTPHHVEAGAAAAMGEGESSSASFTRQCRNRIAQLIILLVALTRKWKRSELSIIFSVKIDIKIYIMNFFIYSI